MHLKNEKLYEIKGGAWSNSVAIFILNCLNCISDLGRYFGSALYHLVNKNRC